MSADNNKIPNNSYLTKKGSVYDGRRNICCEKKKSAFTLAELMVIMSVMAVILAAIAPIFTSRLTNMSFDNVWSTVGASNMNDIYADAPIRSMMQQVMIGVTPMDMQDVRKRYQPYSKLIIRSSNLINERKRQRQIEFRENSDTLGYLFAGNANILLGGTYDDINFTYEEPNASNTAIFTIGSGASGNTAMGYKALDAITNGKNNSAFGYKALSNVTTGSQNTALGIESGLNLTTGSNNTFVGYHSYDANTGDNNTIIGNNFVSGNVSKSSVSNFTTAVGNNINVKGDYNTAIGDSSNAGGSYNTAVGYNALSSENPDFDNYSSFRYNTAIGQSSCSGISPDAQNTTCIGGVGISGDMSSTAKTIFNDTRSRVFIGRPASRYNSAATLEVHSLSTANSRYPYPGSGTGTSALNDSSVIVNGNLIVRGQTFMVGRSPFPLAAGAEDSAYANTISLMGYRLYRESDADHKPLIGVDGSEHLTRITDDAGTERQAYTGREHCICSYSCTTGSNDGRDSYDWSSLTTDGKRLVIVDKTISDTTANHKSFYRLSQNHYCGSAYNVSDSSNIIELNAAHNSTNASFDGMGIMAPTLNYGSCCPILTPDGNWFFEVTASDIRLKNIISPYDYGLDKLLKLNIYDYYYISDKSKTPQVGVIAQDLINIFPDSVKKDDKGYYKIQLEEIFYAAVNSVKELNNNIALLTSKVYNYIARINNLKKENQELKNKLLILSKELEELE